jgi:uncharacterized delta-60 repeat protein
MTSLPVFPSVRSLRGLRACLSVLLSLAAIAFVRAQTPGSMDNAFLYFGNSTFVPTALSVESDGRVMVVPAAGDVFTVLTAEGTLENEFFSLAHKNTGNYRVLRQSGGRLISRPGFISPVGGRSLLGLAGFDLNGTVDSTFGFPWISAGGNRNYNGALDIALGNEDRVHVVGRNLAFSGDNNGVWVTLDRDGKEIFGLGGTEGPTLVAEQPDGKVLLAGAFTTPSGPAKLIRRLPTGELDDTFNANPAGNVLLLRLMPDGRALISGPAATGFPYVAVLKADGSVDPGFNATAAIETYSVNVASVADLLAQPDGKVIVGGNLNGSGKNKALIRLLPSGELDPTFDSALTATSPVTTMVQKDNLLYVGAKSVVTRIFLGEPAVSTPPVITEHPAGGSFAPSASVTLRVVATGTPPLSYQWRFNSQPLGGQTTATYFFQMTQLLIGDYDVVVSNGAGSITSSVARVNLLTAAPTVSLPPTFSLVLGGNSSLGATISDATPPLTYQWLKNDLPLPGETETSIQFAAAKATNAGTYRFVLNDTFGHSVTSGPCVVTIETPAAPLVFADPAGAILPAGSQVQLTAKFHSQPLNVPPVVQWRKNGVNIPGGTVFEAQGLFTAILAFPELEPGDSGNYDAVATNAGGTSAPTKTARLLVKADPSPDAVDLSFNPGTANQVAFNNPSADGAVEGIAVQPDDKIIVVGAFKRWDGQPRTNIVRLNVDGSLDPTFAAHHFTATVNGEITVPGVAVAPDGKIYVTGNWGTLDGGNTTPLVRLNANGTLDATFNPGAAAPGFLLLVQPDGTLLNNGGTLQNGAFRYLLRYPAGGALDVAFGAGFTASRFSGSGPSGWLANPDGSLVLGGFFGANDANGFAQFNLTKLNPNGSVAAGFRSALDQPGGVNHLARLPDGKFVATGDFRSPTRSVRRFNADGSADAAFDSPVTDSAFAPLLVDTDGTVFLPTGSGNEFSRLTANGTVDDTFLVHTDDDIKLTARDSKGRLLIAGYFRQVSGAFNDPAHTVARKSIARLHGRSAVPSTPTEVTLGGVTVVPGGPLNFTFTPQPGVTYVLETKASLGDPTWTVVQTIVGDGAEKRLEAALAGLTGFFRVRVE